MPQQRPQKNSPSQNTFEDPVGETEPIQSPLASCADKQTTEASPVQGATTQQSPDQLTESLSTLKLNSAALETHESEEGLLGEAAGGQDMNSLMLTQGFGDFNTQDVFYAVTPLSWCPHLVAVCPIPAEGLDTAQPCKTCGTLQENWVCLTCYQVYCSRYVHAHMVDHHEASEHPLVLSCVDLSTWCYVCQAYVHHQDLQEVKSAAHQSKFGEDMPHSH